MNLTSTDKIELITSSAEAIHWHAAWVEDDPTADTSAMQSARGVQAAAATIDIVASPASGKTRLPQYLAFTNAGVALNTLTVQCDVSGADRQDVRNCPLMPGESLRYGQNRWMVYDAQGREKVAPPGGQTYAIGPITTVVLAADVTNNNATANTIADVTGLSFAVNAGETYWFRFTIMYTAAATTTGSRWSVNGPGSPTALRYESDNSLTATTRTINTGLAAYDLPAASNATSAATGSNMAIVEGFITPSANGTVIARFASEISASAIVAKAGSILQWQRTL